MGSISTTGTRRRGAGVTSACLVGLFAIGGGLLASCASESKKASSTTVNQLAAATTVVSNAATPAPVGGATATTAATAATEAATEAAAETTAAPSPDGDVALTATGGGQAPDAGGDTLNVNIASSPFGTALAIETTIGLQVDDVRAAAVKVPGIVADHGGAVFDADIQVGDPEHAHATITIKIPPDFLEDAISGLGGLGELEDRQQKAEDVSTQITDVASRIQTAQASVDRVRFLLAGATSLDDIVRIESELTIRETALEQLLASQRTLADRVQLATLTVNITPKPKPVPVQKPKAAPKPKPLSGVVHAAVKGEHPNSIGHALRTGWDAFTRVVHGVVVAVAYGGPFLIIALIATMIGMLVRRRTARHRPDPTTPMPSPAP